MNRSATAKRPPRIPRSHIASRRPDSLWVLGWLTTATLLPWAGVSQEALQNLKNLDSGREQRRQQMAAADYAYKQGDFRLFATPSLGLDWNDNVRTSEHNKESDVILRPMLQLGVSYPLTQVNLLTVNLGVGYDKYIDNDDLSTWRINSGSELSFDIFVKDFTINLHDRISYQIDSSQEAAVANTADYGNFDNAVGVTASWLLRKATLTAGYDHLNQVSIETTFDSQDHTTEMFFGQASFGVHPQVQAGFEGTASFTSYYEPTLNDNANYSAGLFAVWQPGAALRVSPRGGYTIMQFESSSTSIRTEDINTYYLDLTVTHDATEAFSYGFSVGHDLRGGVEADAIEQSYFRPTLTWRAFKHAAINFGLSYERGEQGVGNRIGGLEEKYDWYSATIGTSWSILTNLRLGLNYRLTLRESDQPNRGYDQNVIGLLLTYYPR